MILLKYISKERVTFMKKAIAVLLTAAMLIGVCGVSFSASALQFPKVNDKIIEKYTKCLSNSDSNGLVYVDVYLDAAPMDVAEKRNIAIRRSGVDPADLAYYRDNYRKLTDEEKQYYNSQMIKYDTARFNLISKLADLNCAPFFEQMGITLQYNKNNPIYHNRRVVKNETNLRICLTKNEVFQAAELSYVQGIVCFSRMTGDQNTRTILFENTLGWENVYAFGYDWGGNKIFGDYPGTLVDEKITDEEGKEYYVVRIPRGSTQRVKLSNGEGEYTAEIDYDTIRWGDYYAYRPDGKMNDNGYYIKGFHRSGSTDDPFTPGDGNFVLLDNYNWKEAYIYATDKDGNELYGEFPGKKAKRFLDYGGMQFQITVPQGAAKIVVSNCKGEKTVEINDLNPYHGYALSDGYSLSEKNDAGEYELYDFMGFLEEPGGEEYEHWLEPEGNQYEAAFKNWSESKYGETCLDNGYDYDELYTHFDGGEPDWVLIKAKYYHEEPEPILWLKIGGVGGRTIYSGSIQSPFAFGYGVYNVKENKFYGLECFADDPDDLLLINPECSLDYSEYDGLIKALADSNVGYLTGDVNQDGTVDILDATAIQKYSVNKTDLDDDQLEFSDVNSDGVVDVFDATAIQKYAAA